MTVSKYVRIDQQVEVDITSADVRAALAEDFSCAKDSHHSPDVKLALNDIARFLDALSDEQITALAPEERRTVSTYLAKAADRFSEANK